MECLKNLVESSFFNVIYFVQDRHKPKFQPFGWNLGFYLRERCSIEKHGFAKQNNEHCELSGFLVSC